MEINEARSKLECELTCCHIHPDYLKLIMSKYDEITKELNGESDSIHGKLHEAFIDAWDKPELIFGNELKYREWKRELIEEIQHE